MALTEAKKILQTTCVDWLGDNGFIEEDVLIMRVAIIEIYATDFEERHSTETGKALKGFYYFNMQTFHLCFNTEDELKDYSEEEQDVLFQHFCRPVEFVANLPEEKKITSSFQRGSALSVKSYLRCYYYMDLLG